MQLQDLEVSNPQWLVAGLPSGVGKVVSRLRIPLMCLGPYRLSPSPSLPLSHAANLSVLGGVRSAHLSDP